ncbi:hypothetical protein J7E29_16820 [Streptomyces sp. ISL-90]|nr:hypothetical protein [Streptomyces sp. ISL-90]
MEFGWVHHRDEDLRAAAAGTDGFMEANPEIAASIVESHQVFYQLLGLPPMTNENVFSGNLAPTIEAEREAKTSVTLARMGLYKQALTSLRSALELGLLAVYWDADDQSHVDIQDWWRGSERTPHTRNVEQRLQRTPGVASYLTRDAEFFERVRELGDSLGGYVHTRGGRYSTAGLVPITNLPVFAVDAMRVWADRLVDVAQAVLAVHLMKYPVGLQVTPLSEKFGLNPPAGGFVEPWVRDRFRAFLPEGVRDALQEISDSDTDALERAAWINEHPDIAEAELAEQVERQDREFIEGGGFENWAQVQDSLDEAVREHSTAEEMDRRASYRRQLQSWAEEEGLVTAEDALATMRRKLGWSTPEE